MRRLRVLAVGMLVLALLASACGRSFGPSAEETLRGMGIDANTYSGLDTCAKVRIFADVGMRHLDFDHGLVFVPTWMDQALAAASRSAVATCVGSEGMYRLALLRGGLSSKDQAGRAVHALLYKADALRIVDATPVEVLAHAAVCGNDLGPSMSLLALYWYGTKKTPPAYAGADDEIDRMRAELCQ